jgi:pyruvate dehydrogenase E1 component
MGELVGDHDRASGHRQRSGGMLERLDSTLALGNPTLANDSDPTETAEWLDALESVFRMVGGERAEFILSALGRKAKDLGVLPDVLPFGPYRNTIPLEKQGPYPGDLDMETRITAIIRWNALAMVMRANASYGELGGHVASYASAAEIFEIGFNHFFRGAEGKHAGDVVFFQPHSAPGVYARAFLEGRLTEDRLKRYRQEIGAPGLSSYPHPWLMPDFWQTPTGPWALARSVRSIRRASCATCTIAVPSTPTAGASGGYSVTAKWTSRNQSPASLSPLVRNSTT